MPSFVRGDSEVRAVFARQGTRTFAAERFERGSLRLRQPRNREVCEAVLINTGGGIAGGDRNEVTMVLRPTTSVVVTTQAAEKIYRAEAEPAVISVAARLDHEARLDWLPQETIFYDQAHVRRTLKIDMAGSASLTVLEMLVLGRIAHGEQVARGQWRDRWRIRREDKLIFADDVALTGAIGQLMRRPALGAGGRAIATLLHVSAEAEEKLPAVRAVLARSASQEAAISASAAVSSAAASAWNGMLVVRFAAADPGVVRADAAAVASTITGAPMPRAWSC